MPLLIRRKQLKIIRQDSLNNAVNLENRFLPVLAEMELYGIRVDPDLLMENYEKYKIKLEKSNEFLVNLYDIN